MEFRYLRGVTGPGIARAAAYDISGVVPGTHLAVPSPTPAWRWGGATEGFATGGVHASYLHLNWAGSPRTASRFVAAARVSEGMHHAHR